MSSCATWRADERLRRRPQRVGEPDDQHPDVAVERRRVVGQLLAEHRDVLERALDDALLQVLVVLQDEAEDRRGHEQQREDRQEEEERQQRRRCGPTGGAASRRACRRPRRRRRSAAAAPSPDRSSSTAISAVRQVPVDRRLAVATSAWLARLNGRLPKNPLCADSGDGCADSMIVCRVLSINGRLRRADAAPEDEHDVVGLVADRADHLVGERLPSRALVRRGLPGAHGERGVEQQHALACPRLEVPMRRGSRRRGRVASSLWMLISDGGMRTPRWTEKHSPWACCGPWYGSWPRIITLVSAYGVRWSAANTWSCGGYTDVRRPLGRDERLEVAPVRLRRTRLAAAGSSRSRPSPRLPSMSRVFDHLASSCAGHAARRRSKRARRLPGGARLLDEA